MTHSSWNLTKFEIIDKQLSCILTIDINYLVSPFRYNLTRTADLLNLIVTAKLAICKEGYCELPNTNFLNHYLMPIPRCFSNSSLSWPVGNK